MSVLNRLHRLSASIITHCPTCRRITDTIGYDRCAPGHGGLRVVNAREARQLQRRRPTFATATHIPVADAKHDGDFPSAADDEFQVSLHNFVDQGALDVEASAALTARDVTPGPTRRRRNQRRTAVSQQAQQENLAGWVSYLSRLADGDMAAVQALLRREPQLLEHACDADREADVAKQLTMLSGNLNITPDETLQMLQRAPLLLLSNLATFTSSYAYLLEHLGGDVDALRDVALAYPVALTLPVALISEKLQWLTVQVGLDPRAAVGVMIKIKGCSVDLTLDPHRQWMLRQGFTSAEVAKLVRGCPQLLTLDVEDTLQHRLDFFHREFGIPVDAVRQMLVAQPPLWTLNPQGQLMELKLRFWQDKLGYRLSDLQYAPQYLTYSMTRIASRHSAVAELLGFDRMQPSEFGFVLVQGVGTLGYHIGPRYFLSFLQTCAPGSGAVVVSDDARDALRPLAARLDSPEHQRRWHELLDASPVSYGARGTLQHRRLYANLYDVYIADWEQRAEGRDAAAAEAAAKKSDAVQRSQATAVRRSVRSAERRTGGSAAVGGDDIDSAV